MHGREIQPENSAFYGLLEQIGLYTYGLVWFLFTVISLFRILKKRYGYMEYTTDGLDSPIWIFELLIYEPVYGKNNKIVCTYSEDSDHT